MNENQLQRLNSWLFFIIILLSVLDWVTTVYGISLGYSEGNPFASKFAGYIGFFGIKLIGVLIMYALYYLMRNPTMYSYFACIIIGLQLTPVINNLLLIL